MVRRYLVVSVWLIAAAAAACGDPVETADKLPTGTVIGRIEIAADIPAPKCRVLLKGIPLGDRCDSAGQFEISQIPEGRRDLRIITDPDRKGPLVTARLVAAAINPGYLTDMGAIRVAPAGSIGGRVKAKDGKIPFAIIAVPLYGAVTAPMDNGAYLLKNVPPGTHNVVLTVEGKDMQVTGVEVKSQLTTTKVDFDLALAKAHVVQLLGRAARQGKAEGEHGDLKVELVEVVNGKVIQSGKTLADGRFDIKAKSGIYLLRVSDGESKITATVPYIVLHGAGPIVIDYTIIVPPENGDLDGDSVPNDKDLDIDGDGVPNDKDAFPYDPAESADTDKDGVGDGADLRSKGGSSIDDRVLVKDTDKDGLYDFEDNCPGKQNKTQTDTDGDGVGDDCDNCPYVANKDQKNSVGDDTGDACRSCIVGEACSPKNPCNQGKLACPKAGAVCADVGVPVKNGTPCGTDQVCNNGVCGPCKAGDTCTPPTKPCNRGTYSCTTGTGFCKDIGIFAADGTVCGTNLVCSGGKCVTCTSGGSCDPATLCREGKLDCSNGKPVCLAASTYAPDGTSCGTKLFCKGGSCVACDQGGSCTPPTKPCNKGTFSCSSGSAVCVDSGTPAPDGTACGSGVYCKAGVCTTLPDKLTIVSGDSQSGYIGATLKPVVLKLVDGGGKAKAGETVSFSAPAGGAVTPASAKTNGAGQVTVTPQLGPTLGAQTFKAQAASAPPAQIKASATAAPAGKSFTVVNADQTKGDSGVPGPAASARTGAPHGMAVSKAGAVYFADYDGHRVRVVLPDGTINNVAGTGTYGFSGDYGPATAAKLYYPGALALDEAKQRLYIADSYNNRVRVVDLSLATPTVQTYAGGGSAPAPGYGDGGLAKAAALKYPARLSIGPDGALYIGDGLSRIRRVDPTTRVISTFIKPGTCDSTTTVAIKSCVSISCGVIWDSKGNAFISAGLCGSATGSTSGSTLGIVRRDTSGTLYHVAGKYTGVTTDGADARLSGVKPGRMALDSAGNLLFAEPTTHRVRRIDSRTRLLSTVAGTGSPGKATEYSPAATSPLNQPIALAFSGKDLLIADSYNYSIRRLPGADITAPTAVTLALKSGNNQALKPAQLTPLPLAVKLTAAGSALASVLVFWSGGEAAVGLTASEATTAADGVALVSARPGITAGSFVVNGSFSDIHGAPVSGSPIKLTLPATAPAAGTIFTAVNISGQSGNSGAPGPATLAQLIKPAGLAIATDGTIYVSSSHQVRKITKRGALSVMAGSSGTGTGFYGDNGPADKSLLFYPSGLALDETRKRLYIADSSNNRVRMIDLASGIITTYAGGGSAGPPSYGDGGPATQASLTSPGYLALGSGGVLFIGDSGSSRVRKVDPGTKLITKAVGQDSCAGSPTAGLYSCGGGSGCGLAADASGGVYVSGYICGSKANAAPYTSGIIHVSSSGTVTHVAGRAAGSNADGTAAASYTFTAVGGLARTGTTLYVGQGHRVMKLSTSGGTVVTAVGKTGSGSSGDYGPATAALLKTPAGLAVTPDGHLTIADSGNNRVRIVW